MFTVKYLKSLKSKKLPYRIYEKTSRTGFGIQVSSKGTKTFFYAYQIAEKSRFIKLGKFTNQKNLSLGSITLKEAHVLWQKWYKVKDAGHDPQLVRDNEIQKVQEKHQKTIVLKKKIAQYGSYKQLLDAYIDWLKTTKKRSANNVEYVINANAYAVIKRSTKAKHVTSKHINATLAVMEKRGANISSNRLRAYLLTAFKKAMLFDNGRHTNQQSAAIEFGLNYNPVVDVPKSEVKERVGERFLDESEIKILWETLPNTKISPQIIGILQLMLATGQRVEEVLRLNIRNIDFKARLWELKQTKSKRPHIVPLGKLALQIIDGLTPNQEGFLFISLITGKLIRADSISQSCQRFCQQTGFTKFTPRHLRRTWKTLAGKAGISKFDRDRYQNHITSDVSSRHYDRYDYLSEKRQVAMVWNTYLSDILQDA
jgi:integrase